MSSKEEGGVQTLGGALIYISIVGLLILAGWVGLSYFEAAAYERVTGKRVSTWDAMFLTLRVQEAPK